MVNRIRELLETRQLSPTQFADLIGVGRPVISHILSERNKPSLEVVQKVISAFPDVSLAWLMSGTGPMLTAPTSTASDPDAVPSIPTGPPPSEPPTAFPSLTASASLVAPSTPVTPLPVAPALRPFAAPIPSPTDTAVVAQVPLLPQPPKFRPPIKATPQVVPAIPVTALAPNPAAAVAAPPLIASSLVAPPSPGPAVPDTLVPLATPMESVGSSNLSASVPSLPTVPSILPPELPAPSPYLLSAENPVITPAPSLTTASTPAIPAPQVPSPAPNPAAAFSFLGEAGKTIRRIVLFYSDGSFSDYRPEE